MSEIQKIRSFNRAVTMRIGALNDSYLGRGRPLGQARVLSEIGRGADMRALRERLGLDSGYLTRLLQTLERQGLVAIGTDRLDRRRRTVLLTPQGLAEHAAYEQLSDDLARSLVAPLNDAQRARLVTAMEEVESLLTAASVTVSIEDPGSPDARACLDAYFNELAQRFEEGFDPGPPHPADNALMTPPAGCFLIAWLDSRAVACGALKPLGDNIGEIKRMWVAPDTRGLGLARRLLGELESHARRLGFTSVRLDTNRALAEAQAMYRKAGYAEISRYNDNPYADFFFEKEFASTG